jgi:plasmid stabilization system protein ParE
MATAPKTYRLSPLAVEDLEGVYLYTLRTWSLRQAELYIDDLDRRSRRGLRKIG